jgi:hypothetical protein
MLDTPQKLQGIAISHFQLAFRDVSFSELEIDGRYEIREDSIFFPSGQTASTGGVSPAKKLPLHFWVLMPGQRPRCMGWE